MRPPAFPLLIALTGLNDSLVLVLNALLGALSVPLTGLLARRLGLGEGVALAAALLVALDPLSVRFTAFLGPESLAFAGALAMMICLLALRRARTKRRAILWGAAAALMLLLSVYARPSIYLIWSGLALWLLLLRRQHWIALLTFALLSLAGMQLWVSHNAAAFGNASFSTIGAWTMAYYRAVPVLRLATGMSVAESEAQVTATVQARLGGDPAAADKHTWFAARPEVEHALNSVSLEIFRKYPFAWLATFPTGLLRMYGLVPPLAPRSELLNLAHYPVLLWNWGLLLAAIVGLWRMARQRRRLAFCCVLLFAGYFTAGTLAVKSAGMNGRESRIVFPFLAIAAVFGAQWLLTQLARSGWREMRYNRDWIAQGECSMTTWHQTIIVGNLGRDPELRYMQNGTAVCNLNVAVSERWTIRQGDRQGEQQELTTWYRVAVWGAQAESCNQYLSRGSRVLVTGTVSARAYTNNAGEAAASLELRARDVRFMSGRQDDSGYQGGSAGPGRRQGQGQSQRGGHDDFKPPADEGEIPF